MGRVSYCNTKTYFDMLLTFCIVLTYCSFLFVKDFQIGFKKFGLVHSVMFETQYSYSVMFIVTLLSYYVFFVVYSKIFYISGLDPSQATLMVNTRDTPKLSLLEHTQTSFRLVYSQEICTKKAFACIILSFSFFKAVHKKILQDSYIDAQQIRVRSRNNKENMVIKREHEPLSLS